MTVRAKARGGQRLRCCEELAVWGALPDGLVHAPLHCKPGWLVCGVMWGWCNQWLSSFHHLCV